MSVAVDPPSLTRLAEHTFGLPTKRLPSASTVLERSLVAEHCRLALTSRSVGAPPGSVHILALRRWVVRKLRSVVANFLWGDGSLFLDVLRGGKAPNMEFIGDIISLSRGYYTAAPTRVVPVSNREWVLVSGTPTYRFVESGLPIEISEVGRRISGAGPDEINQAGLPIQTQESYVGLTPSLMFDEGSFGSLNKDFESRRLTRGANWETYLVNDGNYGFRWGPHGPPVQTPEGFVSLLKEPREMGAHRYWLRVTGHGENLMYKIPSRLFKQVCLTLDRLAGLPRTVLVEQLGDGVIASLNFSPPSAQMRWLHAVGAERLGSKERHIRWRVPVGSWKATSRILEKLPIRIEERGESM